MQYTQASTYQNYDHTGSHRYDMVNTGALVELIKKNTDLEVTKYQEAGVRNDDRIGKQNHIVRMRPKSMLVGIDSPELVISNSYDKTRALTVEFGFFRMVCLNGLICGQSLMGFKSRHINFDYDGLLNFVSDFTERAKLVTDQVDFMKSKMLSAETSFQFAKEVYELKKGIDFKEIPMERDLQIANHEAKRLLSPRRLADEGLSAWNVFNRVQENAIKGRRGGFSTLRATNDIKKQIKLNRFMWERTLELAA